MTRARSAPNGVTVAATSAARERTRGVLNVGFGIIRFARLRIENPEREELHKLARVVLVNVLIAAFAQRRPGGA